jgi:hypothetical protein
MLTPGPAVTSQEIWNFLNAGGRLSEATRIKKSVSLRVLADAYLKSFPAEAKDEPSLRTESNHLCRLIGSSTLVENVEVQHIHIYVARRAEEPGLRGRTIRPVTIR